MANTTWTPSTQVQYWNTISNNWNTNSDNWEDNWTEWSVDLGMSWENIRQNWNTINEIWSDQGDIMALESVTNIDDLNASNPVVGDPVSEGDDHIRNIKTALTTDFPNIGGVVSATHTELNALYGVTAGTVAASKALVLDSSSKLNTINVDNIDLDGNTISTTNTNGDLVIAPTGTGDVDFDA